MSLLLPVRYPVKHYSHLDAGAPQISNADGAIKTILKSCLVTGYGAKEGAGWASLFESPDSIVLRLPNLGGAMGAPDIKIDNGGGKYRIVSQDNPTGIDDPAQIAAENLLMRDTAFGIVWHLIATDVGFVFCYQMGENGQTGYARNNILFVGALPRILDAVTPVFVVNVNVSIAQNGTGNNWQRGILNTDVVIKDLMSNTAIPNKYFLDIPIPEVYHDNRIAQAVMLGKDYQLPFFASVSKDVSADMQTMAIDMSGRSMLRYNNKMRQDSLGMKVLYIPLDYWEF